jgi:hypothetical protein
MTLSDLIANVNDQNEEAIIFAKKAGAGFSSSSEALLVELKDEEIDLQLSEIADKYCPGFEYFLEVSIVKEVIEDLNSTVGNKTLEERIERVIHFAEFDA